MKQNIIGKLSALAISTAIASVAVAEPVTLDVTAWKGNEAEPAGLVELIEKFESEHPEIDVELSYIGRLDTDTVIPPRLQGGDPPDVMMTDMALVKIWGDAGLLTSFESSSEWIDRIGPNLKSALYSGDNLYIMPLEMVGMGNFVNMGLLKKVGIEKAPVTIEELKKTCGALAEAGINPMIFTGGFSAPLFVIANGLEGSTDSAAALGSGDATFVENVSFNATIDLVRELQEAKCFDPKQQAGLDPWSTALTEFQGQNFAMMPQGAWNIGSFSQVEGLDYEFAPIPTAKPSGVALDLFGLGWSVASASPNQEAAKTFVDWFAIPENLQVMLDAESAYTPFDDGASGTPTLAEPYNKARADGGIIAYPFALSQWPKSLEGEIWDSLTGFLLDTSKSNEELLQRWDYAVQDAQ